VSAAAPSIPYIAPWATGFSRYSTQILTFAPAGAASRSLTVPANLWWRVIYVQMRVTTGATPGTRQFNVFVSQPNGGALQLFASAVTSLVSAQDNFIAGPGLDGQDSVGVNFSWSGRSLPDVLYAPGTIITASIDNLQGGDITGNYQAAVEQYAEQYDNGVAVLVPTPAVP